ncbi:MAG: hypothetical protein AB1689_28570 [Thermodesulfobacteriota bacterium]
MIRFTSERSFLSSVAASASSTRERARSAGRVTFAGSSPSRQHAGGIPPSSRQATPSSPRRGAARHLDLDDAAGLEGHALGRREIVGRQRVLGEGAGRGLALAAVERGHVEVELDGEARVHRHRLEIDGLGVGRDELRMVEAVRRIAARLAVPLPARPDQERHAVLAADLAVQVEHPDVVEQVVRVEAEVGARVRALVHAPRLAPGEVAHRHVHLDLGARREPRRPSAAEKSAVRRAARESRPARRGQESMHFFLTVPPLRRLRRKCAGGPPTREA